MLYITPDWVKKNLSFATLFFAKKRFDAVNIFWRAHILKVLGKKKSPEKAAGTFLRGRAESFGRGIFGEGALRRKRRFRRTARMSI